MLKILKTVYHMSDIILFVSGTKISLDEFVRYLNEQNILFCSLWFGMSMVGGYLSITQIKEYLEDVQLWRK
jgi:flavorubredoxin